MNTAITIATVSLATIVVAVQHGLHWLIKYVWSEDYTLEKKVTILITMAFLALATTVQCFSTIIEIHK